MSHSERYWRTKFPATAAPLIICAAAAQRAFISWESRLRPAGVIPPFLGGVVFVPAFSFAQRALAAAASLARVAADIWRRPVRGGELAGEPLSIEERRFSRVSICRRIEMACCKTLTEMSMKIPFSRKRRRKASKNSRFFELARLLVRLHRQFQHGHWFSSALQQHKRLLEHGHRGSGALQQRHQ